MDINADILRQPIETVVEDWLSILKSILWNGLVCHVIQQHPTILHYRVNPQFELREITISR